MTRAWLAMLTVLALGCSGCFPASRCDTKADCPPAQDCDLAEHRCAPQGSVEADAGSTSAGSSSTTTSSTLDAGATSTASSGTGTTSSASSGTGTTSSASSGTGSTSSGASSSTSSPPSSSSGPGTSSGNGVSSSSSPAPSVSGWFGAEAQTVTGCGPVAFGVLSEPPSRVELAVRYGLPDGGTHQATQAPEDYLEGVEDRSDNSGLQPLATGQQQHFLWDALTDLGAAATPTATTFHIDVKQADGGWRLLASGPVTVDNRGAHPCGVRLDAPTQTLVGRVPMRLAVALGPRGQPFLFTDTTTPSTGAEAAANVQVFRARGAGHLAFHGTMDLGGSGVVSLETGLLDADLVPDLLAITQADGGSRKLVAEFMPQDWDPPNPAGTSPAPLELGECFPLHAKAVHASATTMGVAALCRDNPNILLWPPGLAGAPAPASLDMHGWTAMEAVLDFQAGDVNGDGRDDFLVLARTAGAVYRVYLFRSRDTAEWRAEQLDANASATAILAMGLADTSDFLDVAWSSGGKVSWILDPRDVSNLANSTHVADLVDVCADTAVLAIWPDPAGFPLALACRDPGSAYLYALSTSGTASEPILAPVAAVAAVVADVNADHAQELLVLDAASRSVLALTSSRQPAFPAFPAAAPGPARPLLLDGAVSVAAVTEADGGPGAVTAATLAESSNGGFLPPCTYQVPDGGWVRRIATGRILQAAGSDGVVLVGTGDTVGVLQGVCTAAAPVPVTASGLAVEDAIFTPWTAPGLVQDLLVLGSTGTLQEFKNASVAGSLRFTNPRSYELCAETLSCTTASPARMRAGGYGPTARLAVCDSSTSTGVCAVYAPPDPTAGSLAPPSVLRIDAPGTGTSTAVQPTVSDFGLLSWCGTTTPAPFADLAVARRDGTLRTPVCGTSTACAGQLARTGAGSGSLTVADVNHDDIQDLVVVNAESSSLTVVLGRRSQGACAKPSLVRYRLPFPPSALSAVTMPNGDLPFLAVSSRERNQVFLLPPLR